MTPCALPGRRTDERTSYGLRVIVLVEPKVRRGWKTNKNVEKRAWTRINQEGYRPSVSTTSRTTETKDPLLSPW